MRLKIIVMTIAYLFISNLVKSQDTAGVKSPVTISGYAEIYYGYDFNHPADHNRPGFVYSHNRTNEVNVNLAFLKAAYNNDKVRANLAFMAGTYTNANLATEHGVLKNIFEANAGVKLSSTANFWLDAGIFASHIGYESAISKNCWTLTRNIMSDNTPYYESGVKLSYTTDDGKLALTGFYLNGWQRISRINGNNKPAGGLEIYYTPSSKIIFNYSNYLGSENADSVGVRRFYNNFYAIFQLAEKFGLTGGLDYGIQQKAKNSSSYYHVLSPVIVGRYQIASQWHAAARVEYYRDQNGVFIITGTPNGFKTTGYSLNIDYAPVPNALIRVEGKVYDSKDRIFLSGASLVNTSPLITASFAISF